MLSAKYVKAFNKHANSKKQDELVWEFNPCGCLFDQGVFKAIYKNLAKGGLPVITELPENVRQDIEIGTCTDCGQELLRHPDDCWHPHYIEKPCPEEPPGASIEWAEWYKAGNRTGRPGREKFKAIDPVLLAIRKSMAG